MNPRAWVNAHLPASTSLGCNGLGLLPLSGGVRPPFALRLLDIGFRSLPAYHQSAERLHASGIPQRTPQVCRGGLDQARRARLLPLSVNVICALPCNARGRKGGGSHSPSAAPVALTHHSQRNGPEAPKGTARPLGMCSALTFFGMSPERRSCGTASNSVMWRDFQPRRIAPATAITQPGPRAPVFS